MIRTLEKKVSDHNFLWQSSMKRIEAASASGSVQFSKVPIINGAPKAVVVYMQDRNFNSFSSNMIKLSVNEKMKYFASKDPSCSYPFYFDLNICFRDRKIIGTLDKRGPFLESPDN